MKIESASFLFLQKESLIGYRSLCSCNATKPKLRDRMRNLGLSIYGKKRILPT